jgi:hypothetical protein
MELPDKTVEDEVRHLTEMAENSLLIRIDTAVTLKHFRDAAIMDAVKALERAELLHREILRRGGSV